LGQLDGACGYLSGAMEFVKDHGVAWRKKIIQLVDDANLDILLIDPTDKPGDHIGENQALQSELQRTGKFDELRACVCQYRHKDLRYTDGSDFLIVMIDPAVPQWGTANEVYVGEDEHKPLFIICEGGLYTLPRWLFGVVKEDLSNVYQSVEEVVAELIALDKGEKPMDDDWILFRRKLERQRQMRRLASGAPLKAKKLPV
jgi:hypothetical protein